MLVLVTTAVSNGLRGELSRWLLEIGPGVFVGHLSRRVRAEVWDLVTSNVGHGRAILVYSSRNEQRLSFATCGDSWEPVDHDGVRLIRRSSSEDDRRTSHGASRRQRSDDTGWSIAARRKRFRSAIERRHRERYTRGEDQSV